MKFYATGALFLLWIAGGSILVAQPSGMTEAHSRWSRVAVTGGMQFNLHDAGFSKLPNIPNCCPQFESGYGTGFYLGALVWYPITDGLNIDVGLNYTDNSAELVYEEREILSVDNAPYLGTFEHAVDAKLATVGLETLLRYNVIEAFSVSVGTRLGYLVSRDFYQKEEIIDPSDRGVFSLEQSRIRNEISGEIEKTSDLQFALLAGLSYTFFLDEERTFWIAPGLYYTHSLTDVLSDDTWKLHAAHAGVRIGLLLPERPTQPPPPPPVAPRAEPQLTAEVDAMGLHAPDSVEPVINIRIEEFVSTKMLPVLNYVFFNENSSEIPQRYEQLRSSETKDFRLEDLKYLEVMPTYYQILNIVGKRLSMDPDAEITLIGTNANIGPELDNLKLSRDRAASVKEYLVSVWNLDPDRIHTEGRNLPANASSHTDPLGIEENRRVEIRSSRHEIMDPLVLDDTVTTISPPMLRFTPSSVAEAGLSKWKLTTHQDGRILEEFSGREVLPRTIDMRIDRKEILDRYTDSPIIYSLTVHDREGKTEHSPEKSIDIQYLTIKKKRSEQLKDKEIDYYNLILFDFGSLELDAGNQRIVERIRQNIDPASEVSIVGYTDKIGDEEFNRRLSEGRAVRTARALGVPIKNARGLGESVLLYDNSTPEGRFHCRTVTIKVVTPISP